ncbi:hypothetical protein D9611_007166 [Ephemerocybe angulata]|uniref:Uncharacterized protein n=1 Tax=Ephemerocybe angulata TaxID=980116 RepID=A0A8H5B243_9AGAR|nr:hypothetical protein D9611_007166 [Tulosesus angulatus]
MVARYRPGLFKRLEENCGTGPACALVHCRSTFRGDTSTPDRPAPSLPNSCLPVAQSEARAASISRYRQVSFGVPASPQAPTNTLSPFAPTFNHHAAQPSPFTPAPSPPRPNAQGMRQCITTSQLPQRRATAPDHHPSVPTLQLPQPPHILIERLAQFPRRAAAIDSDQMTTTNKVLRPLFSPPNASAHATLAEGSHSSGSEDEDIFTLSNPHLPMLQTLTSMVMYDLASLTPLSCTAALLSALIHYPSALNPSSPAPNLTTLRGLNLAGLPFSHPKALC